MTKYLISMFALAAAFFAVGRCTAPAPYVSHANEIDSLNLRIRAANSREIALRKAASDAFARGLAAQAKKPALVIRYIHDTARLHAYSKHVRDSLARLALTGNAADTSEFTFEAVNGVLDLGKEVETLKAGDVLDSTAIAELKLAYHEADSARCACDAGKTALGEEVAILKKEVRRQRFLKWLFISIGLIAGKVI